MWLLSPLLACIHGPLGASMPRAAHDWSVAVSVASGDRVLESYYDLHTVPISADHWQLSTIRTRGSWTEHGETRSFDSAAPSPRDPWPLVLQHLVAGVPAEVKVQDGRIVDLVDPDEWQKAARRAIYGSQLPNEALEIGEPLLDPAGLVADLARDFPGSPPTQGTWERPDKVGGVDVIRRETCETTKDGGWSCTGVADARPGQDARLFETTTFTKLAADRQGLLWIESGYTGTLVTASVDGKTPEDRPISGLRRVQRR